VKLFAGAREAAGRDSIDLDLPEGATVAQLRRQLATEVPRLSGLIARVMFAVDTRYADDASIIRPNAEVACIPPVSGG